MPILAFALLWAVLGRLDSIPRQRAEQPRYPPERERMAIELRTRTQALHFIEAAAGIGIFALMVRFRFGRRLRERGWRDAAIVTAVLSTAVVLGWPFSAYRHGLALRYGLSVQPWLSWNEDWLKATAISCALAIPLTIAALRIARRTRSWWVWAWGGGLAVMIVSVFLVPWLVDPLFHKFRPLMEARPDLVPALESVASRAGIPIPPSRMFEMVASEKTRTVNAYLTGFGLSKRIVLWDTTEAMLKPEQIQSVFAHEAGHYALLHVPKSMALSAAGLLLMLYALYRFMGREAGDATALPKALLFLSVVGFFTEPAVNGYSRWQEHQADIFELEAMHGLVPDPGRVSASVEIMMSSANLEHPRPNPIVVWWLYDHPPSAERVAFALTYDPWKPGSVPKYVR